MVKTKMKAKKAKKTVSKKKTAPKKRVAKKAKKTLAVEGLQRGDIAPNFRIPNDSGHESGLSDFRGRQVVLYFYPKDDTPGCTCEANAFRDGMERIEKSGASVVGVSCDSPESHRAFKEKYGLNFHLLSDTNREVVKKYGVWKRQDADTGEEMGIERTTFLIDEKGKIKKVFPNVDVKSHYHEVLKAL